MFVPPFLSAPPPCLLFLFLRPGLEMEHALKRWKNTLDYRSATGELNAMLVQVLLDRLNQSAAQETDISDQTRRLLPDARG